MKKLATVGLFLSLMLCQNLWSTTNDEWLQSLSFYEARLSKALALLKDSQTKMIVLESNLREALSEVQSLKQSLKTARLSLRDSQAELTKLSDSLMRSSNELKSIERQLQAQSTEHQRQIAAIKNAHLADLRSSKRRGWFKLAIGVAIGAGATLLVANFAGGSK